MQTLDIGRLILLATTASFCLGCGDGASTTNTGGSEADARIINGVAIDQVASPQIAKIVITDALGVSSICSGTVLDSNSAVTAGHCIVDTGAVSVVIERPDASLVKVSAVMVHPGYFRNLEVGAIFNDVAILKTEEALNLPPLGIIASRAMVGGEQIGIYGYGIDENGAYGVLRGGTMTVASVTPNHLFAPFAEGSNTCSGDSGGPATYTLTDDTGTVIAVGLVGITSSGTVPDCGPGDVTYFTNLQSPEILHWILSVVPNTVVQ